MSFRRPFRFFRAFPWFLFIFSTAWSFSIYQDSLVFRPEAEEIFKQALQRYGAKEYREAANLFLRVIKEYPQNHRTTAAYLMAAKSQYHAGAYRESVKLLRNFLDLYPESSFADNAHYTLGLNYYQQHRFEESAIEFLNALQATNDRTLISRSENWLDKLASSSLRIGHIQLLLAETTKDEAKALLSVHLADKIFRSGDAKTAEELLRPVVEMSPRIRSVSDAIELLERIRKGGVLKIGIILPLMLKSTQPAEKEAGKGLLEGIKLATEEYNQIAVPKVNLEIRDSERDPNLAARHTAELCADNDVVAIVGPAYSNEALLSASIANNRGVPMISPTATANGIAGIGVSIFQANPDFNVRGRALAQYAFEQLAAKNVAVLAPNDEVGKALAEAFLDETKKRNGEVVDVEWYEPGTTDLRPQLMTMRQRAFARMDQFVVDFSAKLKNADLTKLLRWGVPQRTLDSLVERGSVASVNFLFGADGKRVADSLRILVQSLKLKSDCLGIPVRTIDALFLPIASVEEIGVVSSQVRYFNFESMLLGGGEWNDATELDQNRQYTNGIIFPTDSYWQEEDEAYQNLAARYQKAFGEKPTKNGLYSYDVMKALLKVIADGARQRNSIVAALSSLQGFQGIHSKISFTSGRVNGVITILRYKNRAVVRLGEIDYATGQFWSGQD